MMKKRTNKKLTSLLLCLLLLVSMTGSATACGSKPNTTDSGNAQETNFTNATVLGEGQTSFYFTVVDKEGQETYFEIHTDKTIVGDALLEHNLIAGDESEYGLYVKVVNGITADYNVDATYWAFYVNDEYAVSGVDSTAIKEGDVYSFKVSK